MAEVVDVFGTRSIGPPLLSSVLVTMLLHSHSLSRTVALSHTNT